MIKDVSARAIYNSRGEKTIRASVVTDKGSFSAAAPSGKSRGKYETAIVDAERSVKQINKIRSFLKGKREDDHDRVDIFLEKFSANISTAVSMACWRASFNNDVYKFNRTVKQFPFPVGNVIGGGVHGGYASIQEFLVIPLRARTIKEAIETNFSIWRIVGKILSSKGRVAGRNDEGAWIAKMDDLKVLELLSRVAKEYGASIGVDFAASQLYYGGKYVYRHHFKRIRQEDQIEFVRHLIETYKLVYVEDPFHENDFGSFHELTRKTKAWIVGDDLYATQPKRISRARRESGGAIIKIDQAGTVTKAMEVSEIAKLKRMKRVVSHRSGETSDSFISDFSVAIGSELIKCGVAGGERVEKLNRLMQIWDEVESPRMKKLRI
ncbi:MAG TPA: enolase [archaeon]|nr:enolase [archaeon]